MECRRPECVEEYEKWASAGGAELYRWVHCEAEGCHEQYWRNKNGEVCAGCGRDICELCVCGASSHSSDEESGFHCAVCRAERQ